MSEVQSSMRTLDFFKMTKHTAQDCSTPSTRRPYKGYVNPHHESIKELLDDEEYTLDTFRINNGSNYKVRRHNSENSTYDYEAYGVSTSKELTPPEEYGDGLVFDEICSQGEFDSLPYDNSCN